MRKNSCVPGKPSLVDGLDDDPGLLAPDGYSLSEQLPVSGIDSALLWEVLTFLF